MRCIPLAKILALEVLRANISVWQLPEKHRRQPVLKQRSPNVSGINSNEWGYGETFPHSRCLDIARYEYFIGVHAQ